MSALDTQIQGTHYKNVTLQPIEITYMLGASPALLGVIDWYDKI